MGPEPASRTKMRCRPTPMLRVVTTDDTWGDLSVVVIGANPIRVGKARMHVTQTRIGRPHKSPPNAASAARRRWLRIRTSMTRRR